MFTAIPAQPEMSERVIVRDPSNTWKSAETLAAYVRTFGVVETVRVVPVGRRKAHRYYIVTASPRLPMAARRQLDCVPERVGRHRTTGQVVKQGIPSGWMMDKASAQGAVNRLQLQR